MESYTMKSLCWSVVLVFLMDSFNRVSSAESKCGRFQFSTLHQDLVTRQEHSALSLPFSIKSQKCVLSNLNNFTITVKKKKDGIMTTVCEIHQKDTYNCTSSFSLNINCTCEKDRYTYTLVKSPVDRSDNLTWTWTITNKAVDSKEITVNIQYPPVVNNLTFLGYNDSIPADVGSTVDVICFWENGNPPTEGVLLDRHGQRMDVQTDARQIRSTLSKVSCDDAGTFFCYPSGATQKKSATLLVRCQPEISLTHHNEVTVKPGANFQLEFHIRSHTQEVIQCQLTEQFRSENSRGVINCNKKNMTGRPPDLRLTIHLDNVQEHEDGVWILTMANDAGEGKVEFRLNVSSYMTLIVAITSGSVAVVATIGFIVVVVCMCRRFRTNSKTRYSVVLQSSRQFEEEARMESRQNNTTSAPAKAHPRERNPARMPVNQPSGRFVHDGTDCSDSGEYSEIMKGTVVFKGGAGGLDSYTDVVDQVTEAEAPEYSSPEYASPAKGLYISMRHILERKRNAKRGQLPQCKP